LELLRRANLESTSGKYGVTAAALNQWCHTFLSGGEANLKIWQKDLVTSRAIKLATENNLLHDPSGAWAVRSFFVRRSKR
jgi:hypothetical protein